MFGVVSHQVKRLVLHEKLANGFIEQVLQDRVRDRKEKGPAGLLHGEDRTVENELTERLFQIVDLGSPEKALDLHRDSPLLLLGGQELFGSEVNIQILPAPGQSQWIVGHSAR